MSREHLQHPFMHVCFAFVFLWFSAAGEWHHLYEHGEHHEHEVESAFCDAELHVGCLLCQALPLSSTPLLPVIHDLPALVCSQHVTLYPVRGLCSSQEALPQLRGPPVVALGLLE